MEQRDAEATHTSGAGGSIKVCLVCRSAFRTRRDTCPKDGSPLLDRDLPPGTVLAGKYRILAEIGRGGMGVVYRAEHAIMGKAVAIKVINPILSADPKFLDMFKSEARHAASFKHPNVLTVHDFGESGGHYYLVMELLEGRSLKKLLDEVKVLPPERAFSMLIKVCDAVAAAHDAGIVHLDLKGENVHVMETPEGDDVRVLDFGLAQMAGSAGRVLEGEMTIGTVGYMAPEQIMGRAVDERTDVYALGVMAYEMLVGALPFPGETKTSVLHSQVQGRISKWPRRASLKVVPKYAKAVILDAARLDPSSRPQSAGELRDCFRRALDEMRKAAGAYARSYGVGVYDDRRRPSLVRRVAGLFAGAAKRKYVSPPAPPGMVFVPAGRFIMGANDGSPDERPSLKIPLDSYFIDEKPVTNYDYARFVQATDHRPPTTWRTVSLPSGTGDLPVTGVTWQDASDYAAWAGKRLPTEEEWEKAARGGDGRAYPWGDKWEPTFANWGGNPRFYGNAEIKPVGSFPHDRSPYGCLDMAGNVKEWTASWYKPYGPTKFRTDDFGERFRVVRGGSYLSLDKTYLRASHRSHARPDETGDTGFRCVKDL